MNKFTEAQLETSFISLLELEGYDYIHGEEVIRDSKEEVLIKEDLRAFLIATYPYPPHQPHIVALQVSF